MGREFLGRMSAPFGHKSAVSTPRRGRTKCEHEEGVGAFCPRGLLGLFVVFMPLCQRYLVFRIKALKVENLFAEEQNATEVCEAAIYFKELKWQKPQATHVNVCVCVCHVSVIFKG